MGLALAQLPDWPACLTRDEALAYSRVAETQLREWEKRGLVRFRRRGPNGQLIAQRADLEAAIRSLFDSSASEGEEIEFD